MDWPEEEERQIRRDCAKDGSALPAALQNAPVVRLGLALYFNAFFDLDSERERGELQSIPRSACFQYAVDYDFDEWQADDLWYYIQRMDLAALKWQKKANKDAADAIRAGG